VIEQNLQKITSQIPPDVTLVAVSKTKPNSQILEAYNAGQRVFGENKVQDMAAKAALLPKDISWHMIGHLQTNKVKYIAPFVSLIHGIDSLKLLREVNKRAAQNNRVIDCLLQLHIAQEETKFGLTTNEAKEVLNASIDLENIRITGVMGMASNTSNENQVGAEFRVLKEFALNLNKTMPLITIVSMGMSNDYLTAIKAGSTMVRVGSAIFGKRN
jgi:pyridoxal phosphate enzyme (YggS family)